MNSLVAPPVAETGGAAAPRNPLPARPAFDMSGRAAMGPIDREAEDALLDRLIAAIDALLTEQVNAILHHPDFQRLEASWRGLRILADQAAGLRNVRIRMLDVSWEELCRDMERAADFDQTVLFSRIYTEEFGTPGGVPFGLLIGDYEVQHRRTASHQTDDVNALSGLAVVAAAAFAPLVMGCAPALLGLDRFSDLEPTVELSGAFQGADHQRWLHLQEQEEARFLGLTLPRVLVRAPYRDDGSRVDGFRFREEVEGRDAGAWLWGNAGYAFAVVVMRAFDSHGWLADIRGARPGPPAGGLVAHLPRAGFDTDRPGVAARAPLEVALTERQERALGELGLIPVIRVRETPFCTFNTCQSVQQARRYTAMAAMANARLSAQLSAILCVSRFAHYVKVLARDRIGSVSTPEECQAWIEEWLRGYVTGNDDASTEMKARYPLRGARVQGVEPPGRPGVYDCVVHLQPHFQFDRAASTFKLTTRIATRQGQ
jgi:type VI secretion system protein ImpD